MKRFMVTAVVMAISQAAAMYLFLRVMDLRFMVSAALAAFIAVIIGFGGYLIQLRSGPRKIT